MKKVFKLLARSGPAAGHRALWAQCRGGSLFARDQKGTGFQAMGSDEMGTYHGLDYALFYMNIRNNAQLRVDRFLAAATARGNTSDEL